MLRFDSNNHISRAPQTEVSSDALDEIPEPFKCPISMEPMSDPVFTLDGHTYERQNIRTWFDMGARSSPQTNKLLPDTRLVTAWTIRKLMDMHPEARKYLRPPQEAPIPQGLNDLQQAQINSVFNLPYLQLQQQLHQQDRANFFRAHSFRAPPPIPPDIEEG